MSVTLDERAREASDALLAAAELRPRSEAFPSPRATLRVAVTAAVVVVAVSVGAVIAFRGSPAAPPAGSGAEPPAQHATGRYRASAVLVDNELDQNETRTLLQDAQLLTIGVVPSRAAHILHFAGEPARLAGELRVVPNEKSGMITITSTQPTADRARLVVDTFGEQLVGYLGDVVRSEQRIQMVTAIQEQTTLTQTLKPIIAQLDALKAAGRDDPILEAKRASLIGQFRTAAGRYEVLVKAVPTARYQLIEATRAVPVAPPTTSHSKRSVGTLLALVALVAGILLVALLAIAIDRRLRARRGTPA